MPSQPRRRSLNCMLALACAAVIAACGGGGGYGGGGGGTGGCGAYSSCTPTVTLTNTAGTVSGVVVLTVTATAQGSYTVSSVQFRVDGTAVGAAVKTSPYSYSWDSSSVADGTHQVSAVVSDSANQTAAAAAVSLTVSNNGSFSLNFSPIQVFPVPPTMASATGTVSVNKTNGAVSGSVTLSGVTASGVELGDAYAGTLGPVLSALTPNATQINQWDIPGTTGLSTAQQADLAAGKLYVLIRSTANANGELRAQLLPAGISTKFVALTGAAEVPAVASTASGVAAVTVDSVGLRAVAHVNVAGLNATGVQIATAGPSAVGTTVAALNADSNDPKHYLNEAITLSAADLGNFTAGLWYANVFTAANPTGEIRGQLADPAKLSQLQADIFTPICAGSCHTGVGTVLPGVQNLTAGNSYAALVNVASIEQSAVLRIKPGDPDNSYLVRKIQGTAGIGGMRMPLGGTPLTQAQIDEVRSWVAAGALNN